MIGLFTNSGDPDQMLHSTASDLGLHCLPVALLRVSRLQLVKVTILYGPCQAQNCHRSWTEFADLDYPVHVQSIIRDFALLL